MIALQYDDRGLSVHLEKAPAVTRLQLQKWMTQVTQHLHRAVVRNMGDGGLIGRRTGTLARSMRDRVYADAADIIGEVWPDPDKAPYGRIQEEGGTIVPRRSQFLAIPLSAMRTANGVARGSAAQVHASPGAFGFARTFIRRGIIFGATAGKPGSVIPLFVLKRSVIIPARHYLDITLRQELPWIVDALERITGEAASVWFGEVA